VPSVYLETSVISYLAARPSRDLVTAARQQITRDWWSTRHRFMLFVSQEVLTEAGAGNPFAAAQRLSLIAGFQLLDESDSAPVLARRLQALKAVPGKAWTDALHLAVAAVHGMDYLLTWDLRHIANARQRPLIERACREAGFSPPLICTPDQLLGGVSND